MNGTSTTREQAGSGLWRVLVYYALLIGGGAVAVLRIPLIAETVTLGRLRQLSQGETAALGLDAAGTAVEAISSNPAHTVLLALTSMLGALSLMIPVAWVYTITKRLRGYDESVVHTLIILPIAVTGIVIIVQNSLALAFSLAGIVAAVRFRSTLEDTKDAVYVFLAIGVGLAAGAQALGVALVLTLIFNGVVLVLWRFDIGNVYSAVTPAAGPGNGGSAFPATGAQGGSPAGDGISAAARAGLASRIDRYAAAEGRRSREERLTALLVIHSAQVVQAMDEVEALLEREGVRWRMTEIIPGMGPESTIEYLVRLNGAPSPGALLEAIRTGGEGAVMSAEYHSLHGWEEDD